MDGNIGTKKNAKRSKITKTIVLVVMAIILIAVVAGNVVCGVLSEMITTYFGGYGLDTSNIDYASSQAACEAIEAEGAVLVKNENNALPLKDVKKINVFGWSSISPSYSGGGSGSYAFFLKSRGAAVFHAPGTALKLEKREKRSKPSHKAR